MSIDAEALKAINALNGFDRSLNVNEARPKEDRPRTDRPGGGGGRRRW
jgi:hypothetical protein